MTTQVSDIVEMRIQGQPTQLTHTLLDKHLMIHLDKIGGQR